MLRTIALAALGALLTQTASGQTSDSSPFSKRWLKKDAARLEALDKVTGRTSIIELAIDSPSRFGTLDIVVRSCHRRPPELPPDSAGFLEVAERRNPTSAPTILFSGWMFASSPGLSALEHAVYDVVVLECIDEAGAPRWAGASAVANSSQQAPDDPAANE